MPSASLQAMSPSQNLTVHEAAKARPSALFPQTAGSAPLSSSSSPSSSSSTSVSTQAPTSSSTIPPSFNLRDFMVDDDADQATSAMFKFMDEDAIIRAQLEALKALNDAALAQALRESEETAVLEEMRRKDELKQEEVFTPHSGPSTAIHSQPPVAQQVKREESPSSSSSSSPPPERYPSSNEAAARLLARQWKVASLQGALFQNPDIMPLSSPVSSTFTSASRKGAATLPVRPPRITIPAEEFYSRSPPQARHHRQGSTSTSASSSASASSKGSPPPAAFVTPDLQDKPSPRIYTSASSAAAAHAAAKLSSSADRARPSPTQAVFESVYASASPPLQTPSASTSQAASPGVLSESPPAEATTSLGKSGSLERARPKNAPSAAAISLPEQRTSFSQKGVHTSTSSKAFAAAPPDNGSKASTTTERSRSSAPSSPGAAPTPSLAPQPTVMTSASKVAAAAEKEKARMKRISASTPTQAAFPSVSISSASAAANRGPSPSRPASREAPPTSLFTTLPSVSQPPPSSPVKLASVILETSVPAPQGEQVALQVEVENASVEPISKPNDDDDDDGEDDEDSSENANIESIPFRDLYTANRSCLECGKSILSPRKALPMPADFFSFPPTELLHFSCTSCGTLYCRGCSTPAKCPKGCSGSKACSVRDCCPQVCAIAIFEILGSFDHEFSNEPGLCGIQKSGREEYIQTMITRPTLQTKKLELTFLRTMRSLTTLFQSSTGIHPTVGDLFERSLMPEVIHGFLRNTNVRDWIAHSDTYCAILTLLRYMVEGGLNDVTTKPLRRIETSCGLKNWMWGKGAIVWASGDNELEHDRERRGREMYRGELKGGAEKVAEKDKPGPCSSSAPLGSLMRQLEAHRRPLLALSAKVQFPATVEKVNALCDGISYLVLQQVLGCI